MYSSRFTLIFGVLAALLHVTSAVPVLSPRTVRELLSLAVVDELRTDPLSLEIRYDPEGTFRVALASPHLLYSQSIHITDVDDAPSFADSSDSGTAIILLESYCGYSQVTLSRLSLLESEDRTAEKYDYTLIIQMYHASSPLSSAAHVMFVASVIFSLVVVALNYVDDDDDDDTKKQAIPLERPGPIVVSLPSEKA
ncbi:hypothetical protein FISHEDRAFT_57296 [Fistulina hepatica ATCC 64428]|uniref:Uncharacterized protein n=1 Tax=Fistulina hepatica ATCC 64428 TaxID=1128425 RepID=A0A0D7AGN5_9AGAR|nr:hypothetical protein FISHEDRAFT_57296 [Fistulina hepatica ATCC 64428]